jgi:hypothetical protein
MANESGCSLPHVLRVATRERTRERERRTNTRESRLFLVFFIQTLFSCSLLLVCQRAKLVHFAQAVTASPSDSCVYPSGGRRCEGEQ